MPKLLLLHRFIEIISQLGDELGESEANRRIHVPSRRKAKYLIG